MTSVFSVDVHVTGGVLGRRMSVVDVAEPLKSIARRPRESIVGPLKVSALQLSYVLFFFYRNQADGTTHFIYKVQCKTLRHVLKSLRLVESAVHAQPLRLGLAGSNNTFNTPHTAENIKPNFSRIGDGMSYCHARSPYTKPCPPHPRPPNEKEACHMVPHYPSLRPRNICLSG